MRLKHKHHPYNWSALEGSRGQQETRRLAVIHLYPELTCRQKNTSTKENSKILYLLDFYFTALIKVEQYFVMDVQFDFALLVVFVNKKEINSSWCWKEEVWWIKFSIHSSKMVWIYLHPNNSLISVCRGGPLPPHICVRKLYHNPSQHSISHLLSAEHHRCSDHFVPLGAVIQALSRWLKTHLLPIWLSFNWKALESD